MLTYQIRPRLFRFDAKKEPTFPAEVEICIHFQPEQPFGAAAGGGHTGVKDAAASTWFNANTGEHSIESKPPLSPLDVTIEEPIRTLCLAGNVLSISQEFASLTDVEEFIQAVYFVLPTLLNVPYADPPYIERVDGKIGSTSFRWEIASWQMTFGITTQELQEAKFATSWKRMSVLTENRRRLAAGLHYFHVACRLTRAGSTAGEFVAEVILNLAKSLEVIFPPGGDGQSRDSVRDGLRTLGYSNKQIECDFVPAMALRNEIDVAHVELGLFTMDQLKTIHAFTERAELAFRDMFDKLLTDVEAGNVEIASHELGPPRREVIKLIERLKESTEDRQEEDI